MSLSDLPSLFVRSGESIVEAPVEDRILAAGYPNWRDKGLVVNGRRISILTRQEDCLVGEEVRVIHAYEVLSAQYGLFVSGPKLVCGEYLDEILVSSRNDPSGESLRPALYDGRVVPGPGVDFNFEITTYAFSSPGARRLRWKVGSLQSNVIVVSVSSTSPGT